MTTTTDRRAARALARLAARQLWAVYATALLITAQLALTWATR